MPGEGLQRRSGRPCLTSYPCPTGCKGWDGGRGRGGEGGERGGGEAGVLAAGIALASEEILSPMQRTDFGAAAGPLSRWLGRSIGGIRYDTRVMEPRGLAVAKRQCMWPQRRATRTIFGCIFLWALRFVSPLFQASTFLGSSELETRVPPLRGYAWKGQSCWLCPLSRPTERSARRGETTVILNRERTFWQLPPLSWIL